MDVIQPSVSANIEIGNRENRYELNFVIFFVYQGPDAESENFSELTQNVSRSGRILIRSLMDVVY